MLYNIRQKLQPARKTTSVIASVVAGAGLALTAATLPAAAASFFEFEAKDAGGTGSATMSFDGLGTSSVTVLLDNTSPLTLDDGTGVNSPGITFFGFDGLGADPGVSSWTLTAEDASGDSVVLSDWSLDAPGFRSGVTLDYLFTNDGNVKGALYNPDATSGLAASPNYFTTATLEIEFDDAFTLDETSTFVRMQNVGNGGEGSLKITGDPRETIPEPSTLGALGLLAAAGMFGVGKKRKQM